MKPFQNELKSLVDKKQQEDTLRGCMWRSEMLHKLKLHHHHDKIKGLWCIVKLTDEFNFSELLSLTIKILMRFVFFGFIWSPSSSYILCAMLRAKMLDNEIHQELRVVKNALYYSICNTSLFYRCLVLLGNCCNTKNKTVHEYNPKSWFCN